MKKLLLALFLLCSSLSIQSAQQESVKDVIAFNNLKKLLKLQRDLKNLKLVERTTGKLEPQGQELLGEILTILANLQGVYLVQNGLATPNQVMSVIVNHASINVQ